MAGVGFVLAAYLIAKLAGADGIDLSVYRVWTPRRMQGFSLGESMWSGAFVCPAS
jgi:Pyruvate/2-oxoacid:ferredoxin oxidoreductase gamma subunit